MFDISTEKGAVIFESKNLDLMLIVFSPGLIITYHKGKLKKHPSYEGVMFFLLDFPKAVQIAFELNWRYIDFSD